MSILTPQQAEELLSILVGTFDKGTIGWVVRVSLGPSLDSIVNVDQSNERVVYDLLKWVEQRGEGTLVALLQRAVAARPEKLQAFCEKNFPKALEKVDPVALVQNVTRGLQLLIDMKDRPAVRETVGGFRADLETTSRQIRLLKKYKALHDSLHELQLRLEAIGDALGRSATDTGALRALGMYADALGRLAKSARSQIPGLPSLDLEESWIDDFDDCIRAIVAVSRSTAALTDRASLADISNRLRALLNQSPRINAALANAADALRLDQFIQTMDLIARNIRTIADANDTALKQLVDSSSAVSALQSRLAGLVSEHYEWQWFNTQLDGAELSSMHQPQAKMARWLKFKDKLTGLCDISPNSDWSIDIKDRLAQWIADTSSAASSGIDKTAGEIAFANFHRACVYRFFDVDKELDSLSEQVTEVVAPLRTLLTAIQ